MRREKAKQWPVSNMGVSHCIVNPRGDTHPSKSPLGLIHIEGMENYLRDLVAHRRFNPAINVQYGADWWRDILLRCVEEKQTAGTFNPPSIDDLCRDSYHGETVFQYRAVTRLQRNVRDLALMGSSVPMIADILSIRESVLCPHCDRSFDYAKDYSEHAIWETLYRVRDNAVVRKRG